MVLAKVREGADKQHNLQPNEPVKAPSSQALPQDEQNWNDNKSQAKPLQGLFNHRHAKGSIIYIL